jgi:hypothetical protein
MLTPQITTSETAESIQTVLTPESYVASKVQTAERELQHWSGFADGAKDFSTSQLRRMPDVQDLLQNFVEAEAKRDYYLELQADVRRREFSRVKPLVAQDIAEKDALAAKWRSDLKRGYSDDSRYHQIKNEIQLAGEIKDPNSPDAIALAQKTFDSVRKEYGRTQRGYRTIQIQKFKEQLGQIRSNSEPTVRQKQEAASLESGIQHFERELQGRFYDDQQSEALQKRFTDGQEAIQQGGEPLLGWIKGEAGYLREELKRTNRGASFEKLKAVEKEKSDLTSLGRQIGL